jgi:ubiquinone/menaquinone biosynthesis C-methylase UbiE
MTASGSAPYFDTVAEEYASWYEAPSADGYALRVRQERVLELLDLKGGRVLDVGCGPGMLGAELLRRGYEFWGVDAAPGMLAQCRRRLGAGRARLAVGDAARLPFPDGAFDAVICMGVIGNVRAGAAALAELARLVRPGGTLVVSLPNPLSPYGAWKSLVFYPVVSLLRAGYYRLAGRPEPRALYRFAWRPSLGSRLLHFPGFHTVRDVRELLARRGAEVTDVVHFYFNVFLSPLDQLFPRLAVRAARGLERLRRGPLRFLGAGFVVRARAAARPAGAGRG